MSSDYDLTNELLALAEDSEDQPRRRKRSSSGQQKSAAKRRKQEHEDDYEDDLESEEDEANPYPLEGKYADELDRQRLLDMPETEREDILAQRLEEMQRFQDKVNLDKMLKAQKGSPDGQTDSVAKAAKRKHTSIGATKEKTKGLEQLKEKRRAKQDNVSRKARTSFEESPAKRRSSTPSTESSDEEGQFRPGDDSLDHSVSTHVPKKEEKEEPPTIGDFHAARLTREQLAKFCHVTWFQELVQGAYVRYLIGDEGGVPVYRLCEVVDLGPDFVKPYSLDNQVTNQVLELRHGKDTKHFPMDKVSNGPFTEREVDRFLRVCHAENVKPPTKSRLEQKSRGLQKLTSQAFTDSDINKMMERKAALQQRPSHAQVLQEKSRLNQARNLARSRRDAVEVAELDIKIAELEAQSDARAPEEDQWAKVNERNRRLNLEQTKKAEAISLAKRKALMASRGNTPKPGTPKPEGAPKQETAANNLAPPPDVVPVGPAQTTFDAMVQAVSLDIDF